MNKEYTWLLVGTIISWSIGFLGADRIYKGDIGLGIFKLLTLGGFGVWWLVDALIWTNQLGKASNTSKK
jgi:TM2 domain-containing membrane protein YozV